MPITLPSYVAPNELIASAWGNAVVDALDELDTEKLNLAGAQTVVGPLTLTGSASSNLALRVQSGTGVTEPFIEFGPSADRTGFIQIGEVNSQIAVEDDSEFFIAVGGVTAFEYQSTLVRALVNLIADGNVLCGKTSAGSAVVGSELNPTGAMISVQSTDLPNLIHNKTSSAVVNDAVFASFRLSNTPIGSITRSAGTSAVLFNTTSDANLKLVDGVDAPGEALDRIMRLTPKRYRWTEAPELDAEVGLLAQDAIDVMPYAVSPGRGSPGDEDYQPMGIDYGRITPDLVGAVHAIVVRLEAVETAVKGA